MYASSNCPLPTPIHPLPWNYIDCKVHYIVVEKHMSIYTF